MVDRAKSWPKAQEYLAVCFSSFYTYKIEYFCSLSKPDDALGGAKRVACLLNHMHYLSAL